MSRSTMLAMLLLVVFATGACARAWASDASSVRVNGYGTLGVVHSDEDDADFVSSILHSEGAGHSSDWSAEVDSRFGLQLSADITSRLSAFGQVVLEQGRDDSPELGVEWANLQLDLTEGLSSRVGRIVLPISMISEYRKVGYATPWVRPPQEVYRLAPIAHVDGLGFTYGSRIGDFHNKLIGTLGNKEVQLPGNAIDSPDDTEFEGRDIVTIANVLERGSTTLFASYSTARLAWDDLEPLFDGFRSFGAEGEAIADRYDVNGKRFRSYAVGVRHDPGDWFVMGEWMRTKSRTFIAHSKGWYVTGGYRHGAFTPYVTLARVRATSATSDPGLSTQGLPPQPAAQAEQLNAALNRLLGSAAEQKSVSLGVRWDFARNVAMKVQVDHIDLDDGSAGVLFNEQPDFERGGSLSLFSATLDFVF